MLSKKRTNGHHNAEPAGQTSLSWPSAVNLNLIPPASGKMLERLILAWLFCSQRFDDSIEREHGCCNKKIKLQLFGMVRLTLKVNGQLFGMVGLTLNVDDQLFGMVRLTSAIPPKLTANLFPSFLVTFAKT